MIPSPEAIAARVQSVVELPLHQALGIRDIHSEDGRGRFEIVAENMALNPAGMLHGGVTYLLSDVCAYAGLLSLLSADEEAVTHDIHVSVMRPVAAGQTVTVSSQVVRRGRALCFLDVTVESNGKQIATAHVTKSIVRNTQP